MALGDGKGVEGVNQRLVKVLEGMDDKRLGIVMFDFFDQPQELMELFLGLKKP